MREERSLPVETEILKYQELSGLQGRMILMANNLNPDAEFEISKDEAQAFCQQPDQIDQSVQTVLDLTDQLSLEARLQHWQNQSYEKAMERWRNQISSKIKKFGPKHHSFLTKLGIKDLNQFNPTRAQELYDRFAVVRTDQTPLQFFLDTVFRVYENNLSELQANLNSVCWLAGIFGHDEAEIIANLVDAKIKTSTQSQEFANEVVGRSQKEQLTAREKVLLAKLYSKQLAKSSETPPIEPPPIEPPPSDHELDTVFKLEDWFAGIRAPVDSSHNFYVDQLPRELTIASETHKIREPFFEFREDESGQQLASPNKEVAPWVEELEVNRHDRRYLEAEEKTDHDSGLAALAAASAKTPEQQAQLYRLLANNILFLHQNDPKLLLEWLTNQGEYNVRDNQAQNTATMFINFDLRQMSAILAKAQQDKRRPTAAEAAELMQVQLMPFEVTEQHGLTYYPEQVSTLWEPRLKELQEALSNNQLQSHHLRWLEFLSHSVNVNKIIELLRTNEIVGQIKVFNPESAKDLEDFELMQPTIIDLSNLDLEDRELRLIPYLEKLGLSEQFNHWTEISAGLFATAEIQLPGLSREGSNFYYFAIRKDNEDGTTQYSCNLVERTAINETRIIGHVDFTKLANSNEANCSTNQLSNILRLPLPNQLNPDILAAYQKWQGNIEAVKIDGEYRGQGLGKSIWYLALSQGALAGVTKINIIGDLTRGQRPDQPAGSFYENLGSDALILLRDIGGQIYSSTDLSSSTYLSAQLDELQRLLVERPKRPTLGSVLKDYQYAQVELNKVQKEYDNLRALYDNDLSGFFSDSAYTDIADRLESAQKEIEELESKLQLMENDLIPTILEIEDENGEHPGHDTIYPLRDALLKYSIGQKDPNQKTQLEKRLNEFLLAINKPGLMTVDQFITQHEQHLNDAL